MLERSLSELANRDFDVVIVGGGIFGVCAAWDAALRNLSVAIVERCDFGGGASAHSYKIVHGGIRYLQHADLVRIRQSCHERSSLLRVAPHLVQPLPIVIPTYGHGKNGKTFLAAGLLAYDFLTLDRNRGVRSPDRRIPRGRLLTREEVLDLFPGLKRENLTGGALFCDGQMYNPTRLTISFLRSAVARGAVAANYVEAVNLLRSENRVTGIQTVDRMTGETFPIHGKVVLNAAGPWAENLLAKGPGIGLKPKGTYSRDACFVVQRQFAHDHALAVQGRTHDPDAILSRDARHLFVVPWRNYSLIGVWHKVYDGDPDQVKLTELELQEFIDEINWAYPDFDLKLDDVLMWNAGLVPFGENAPDAVHLSYGKRSLIIDHAQEHGVTGLITLIGIRYTMARGDAANAVDLVVKKLDRRLPRPATGNIPIHGGNIENFADFVGKVGQQISLSLNESVLKALLHNYGSEYGRVIRYVEENPSWIESIGDSTVIKAEVIHAVREEMALKLADVVFRRTDIATGHHPGTEAIETCGQLVAEELGWGDRRLREEIDEINRTLPSVVSACDPTVSCSST
jgi:glycerol-3-phosphate dehydrogenase